MSGYTTAEENCTGCMGACGECKEFTEQAYYTYQLQKMSDSELAEEMQYLVYQSGARLGQFFTREKGSALTLEMIKSDLVSHLDRFEAISQEMERRVIP